MERPTSSHIRQDRRAHVPGVSVRYEIAPSEFALGDALEMSVGGLFIRASARLPVGRLLETEIRVTGELPISAIGRVMWTREEDEGEGRPAGMGVKLIDVEDESREVIGRLVARREPTLHGLGPVALDVVRAPEPSIPIHLVRRKSVRAPTVRAPSRSGSVARLFAVGALLWVVLHGPTDSALAAVRSPATSRALVASAPADEAGVGPGSAKAPPSPR